MGVGTQAQLLMESRNRVLDCLELAWQEVVSYLT